MDFVVFFNVKHQGFKFFGIVFVVYMTVHNWMQ